MINFIVISSTFFYSLEDDMNGINSFFVVFVDKFFKIFTSEFTWNFQIISVHFWLLFCLWNCWLFLFAVYFAWLLTFRACRILLSEQNNKLHLKVISTKGICVKLLTDSDTNKNDNHVVVISCMCKLSQFCPQTNYHTMQV